MKVKVDPAGPRMAFVELTPQTPEDTQVLKQLIDMGLHVSEEYYKKKKGGRDTSRLKAVQIVVKKPGKLAWR